MYNVRSTQIVILKDINHPVCNLFAWKKMDCLFQLFEITVVSFYTKLSKDFEFHVWLHSV